MSNARRDGNFIPAMQGVSSVDGVTPTDVWVNPLTHAVLIDSTSLYSGLDTRYATVSQATPQTIGSTGSRLTKLWATDITVTNAITGSITGNAGTVTNGVYTTDKLSVLSATTSAELAGVISDETGSGSLVFATSPVFTTNISTPLIIGAGAIGITPASGSNLNITLATTGDLAVNTNQLYVDTSAGFVGIGTTGPLGKLSVAGSIYADTTQTNTVFSGTVGTDNANLIGSDGYWALRTNTANAFNIDVWNSGTPLAAMTVIQNGNVGIGTTNPAYKLETLGGTTWSGTFTAAAHFIQDKTNYRGIGIGYDTASQTGVIAADTAGAASNIAFWTYNSGWGERVRIQGNGNVGIGTTNPSGAKLVLATPPGAGFTPLLYFQEGTADYGFKFLQDDAVSGNMRIDRVVAGVASTVMTFARADGNVGIGTTAPAALLQIGNGSHASDTVYNQLFSTGNTSGVFSTPSVKISDNTATYAAFRVEPSVYVSAGKTLTNYYGIANTYQGAALSAGTITNSYGLYINTPLVGTNKYGAYIEGNVGIGTTAPDKVLEVNLGTASALRLTYNDANGSAATYMDTTVSSVGLTTFTATGSAPAFALNAKLGLKGYTVAALPTGAAGDIVYVTDQLTAAAAKGVAPTGGGAVKCVVFHNGTAWVGI